MTVMLVEGLELYASLSQRGVRGEIRFSGDEEVYIQGPQENASFSFRENAKKFADISGIFSFIQPYRKQNLY
jgi:hypothetical protein